MALKIYNTLSHKKEEFQTLEPKLVKMYVCGPTVYSKAHVGHAMSALVFDVIRRYLEYRGYQVRHVMNFTDVDDKIIQRAHTAGVEPVALAQKYIAEFQQHLVDLHVLPATVNPRATEEISGIQAMIAGLIEKNHAYPVDGDVYFRVRSDKGYGKLSHRQLDEMEAGARIEVDARKEDPLDFALWKAAKPGEPFWESPWGKGRPGWHIECSAMNLHYLGEQIDIHGGGNDLIFPHHENEIAQSESFTGKPFARYWVHNGMLQFAGEKMSKSLGNLVTIEDFLAQHSADTLRMMVLNSGYRSPLTFNEEIIQQAEHALNRIRSAFRPAQPGVVDTPEPVNKALRDQLTATQLGFVESMDDDFNTAGALGHLFDLVRAINVARDGGADSAVLKEAQDLLAHLAGVLGLALEVPSQEAHPADAFIDMLVDLRQELRRQKMWALADQVRERLSAAGVTIEDTREGSTWHWA